MIGKIVPNHLQVIHSRGDHWVVASNVDCSDEVKVYDSVFQTVDETTNEVIDNLFHGAKINLVDSQKQEGKADFGCLLLLLQQLSLMELIPTHSSSSKH